MKTFTIKPEEQIFLSDLILKKHPSVNENMSYYLEIGDVTDGILSICVNHSAKGNNTFLPIEETFPHTIKIEENLQYTIAFRSVFGCIVNYRIYQQ